MTVQSEPHPSTGQPVGVAADATPAARPGPVTLEGRYGRVERLAQHHDKALWEAVQGHDTIWTYLSTYGPFADFAAFSAWIGSRLPLEDPYSYAIVEPSGRAVGISTLMEIRPAMRSISVFVSSASCWSIGCVAFITMPDTATPARSSSFKVNRV